MSNYTDAMVAKIRAAAPLNLAKAKALASDFGSVSHRSVISKAQSLGVGMISLDGFGMAACGSTPRLAD